MDEKLAYWMSGYVNVAQPLCDEPLVAAQTFQQSGIFATQVQRGLNHGWSPWGANKRNAQRAGGLPGMVLIAVGPTKVYAFAYAPKFGAVNLDPPLHTWARDTLQVSSDARRVASKLTIDDSDGGHYELESTSMTGRLGKMTLEVFRLLSDPSAN